MKTDELLVELGSINVQMRRLQRRESDLRRELIEVIQVTDLVSSKLHSLNRLIQQERNKDLGISPASAG